MFESYNNNNNNNNNSSSSNRSYSKSTRQLTVNVTEWVEGKVEFQKVKVSPTTTATTTTAAVATTTTMLDSLCAVSRSRKLAQEAAVGAAPYAVCVGQVAAESGTSILPLPHTHTKATAKVMHHIVCR
ncbi:unnamed protein product [Ceratitis capitata]|uniref:(Mediterranean fruit fly) hypothetical protein n=1 Tax=Ceratitis capitata TaxID=7213 RepID=A0A811V9D1_CERCA|nr:unnamed protein product [Ceratitis capitata]